MLEIKDTNTKLVIYEIDSDEEIELCLLDNDNNTLGLIFLNAEHMRQISNHLLKQLREL
jgi:hypothetical protein